MMKLKSLLAAFLAIAFLVGCNENTTDPVDGVPAAPTALMANAGDASVMLKWTPPSGTITGYEVTVKSGTTTVKTENITTGDMYKVDGLTNGTIYTLELRSVNSTGKSATAAMVTWAPAKRGTDTYKIYSSKSSSNGSGLNIFDGMPAVLKIGEGEKWDICFDDKDGNPLLGSPGVSGYVDNNFQFPNGKDAKIVSLGRMYTAVNSLDEIFDTQDLSVAPTGGKIEEKLINLSSVTDQSKGVAFVARYKVNDNTFHYAKVLVKSVGGMLVQGAGNEQFVEVEISYQTVANVPHALMAQLDRVEQNRAQKLNMNATK